MVIHTRLREIIDGDLVAWYKSQADKAEAVRSAIRAAIRLQDNGLQELIREAVARELARLPDIVAAAVHEALSSYRLTPAPQEREPGEEDPELATRLDGQLSEFFGE